MNQTEQKASPQPPSPFSERERVFSAGKEWKFVRPLVDAPRWLFVAALVFAPWAYGCTQPWASQALAVILGVVVVLWLAGCIVRRSPPAVPLLPFAVVLSLLAQGWWMALNSKSIFSSDVLALSQSSTVLSQRPGSIDGRLSIDTMFVLSSLLGAMLFVTDVATRPVWRKRIWVAMAWTGVSIALFGIVQKVGGEPILSWIWEKEKIDINNNFGMYRYRGNAGAYLNLVLPIVVALAVEAFRKRHSHQLRTFWAAAVVIVIAAVQLNPSRAGWAIALLMTATAGCVWCWQFFKRTNLDTIELRRYGVLTAIFTAALAVVCWLGGWQTSWKRLNLQGISPVGRSPTEIYLAMAPDAGILGFGPGTFRAAFPGYQLTYDFGSRSVPEFWISHTWIHAHQDYLQTVVEWGFLGALLWAVLFAGGFWQGTRCVRAAIRSSYKDGRTEAYSRNHLPLMCGSLLAIAGVLLHALVDFPLQIVSIQFYVVVLLGICWRQRET